MSDHPFASGELLMHHRYEQGTPITCGVAHGFVTAVVDDVRCPACVNRLRKARQMVALNRGEPMITEDEARMIGRAIREEAKLIALPIENEFERRRAVETRGVPLP